MAAYYDTYDYPAYWKGREYEHKAEVLALKGLLDKIPKIRTILEVGAGYGRLTPSYFYRAKRIILSDPSAKLLSLARETFKNKKNVSFIQSSIENLPPKVRRKKIDLVIMVRVIHHIGCLEETFTKVNKILTKNGYFILEFANKKHFKATVKEFLKGNFTFPLDIFPKELGSKRPKKEKCIAFRNYHPDEIKKKLEDTGFKIIDIRSVSNIRSTKFKKLFSTDLLLSLEKVLQKLLSKFNFGPSIFLLIQKKG